MFGYKLKLIKKKQLQDMENFRVSVFHIHEYCDEIGLMFIGQEGFDMNPLTIYKLRRYTDYIREYTNAYVKNTYSLPMNALKLTKSVDELTDVIQDIISLIGESMKVMMSINKHKHAELLDDDDIEDISEYDAKEINADIQMRMYKLVNIVMGILYDIDTNILYDCIRTVYGVDMYLDNKNRLVAPRKLNDVVYKIGFRHKDIHNEYIKNKMEEVNNGKCE